METNNSISDKIIMQPSVFVWGLLTLSLLCATNVHSLPLGWDRETSVQVLRFGCESRDGRPLPTTNLYSVSIDVCNRILQILRSGQGTWFYNYEGCLPQGGSYNEYDVNYRYNPERIVVDRSTQYPRNVYYTPNHYRTFVKVTIPYFYPSSC